MYNVALFGAGRIGQVVHSVNIANHPETNLYSVIDPFAQNAQKIADTYGCKIQTVEEAINDPSVQAVLIASATDTHAELIELAAKAGKAIFCEKPVHLDMERVVQCLKVVDDCKVPLFIGFNRRWDPQFKAVKERASMGQIGKAESLIITSRDPSPPPVEYIKVSGGLFRDMTIHDFDMARYIMGEEPESIYACGTNIVDKEIGKAGDIDTCFIVMRFPSGAMATISNTRRSGYGYDQRLELHGEKGVLTAKNLNEDEVELWTDEGCRYAKPEFFFLERYKAAYIAEWAHFVDVLNGKAQPATSGFDGKQALNLADKAYESLKTGKEIKL
ncbi:inositol 2-dehydrogenase [Vibrio sp.]|uniref:Inositol 2-dehydrogenase n=1 Tax=Vibrio viridaestus TaxID=2487322 RepID=A0A3N9TFY7_9VIBR|nr:inositol 2-dehydrogenase [Vibrio viridaestus]MDC0611147.1 inositol 2-dehydrogenase [Vibrio sp.]RQW62900.1 inositol 2-dehydrogenase [Vibrio viridaestus]